MNGDFMNKKIYKLVFSLLLVLSFPLIASAGGGDDDSWNSFDPIDTTSGCQGYTKSECVRRPSCTWIEEHNCGIDTTKSTYKCYYYLDYGGASAMVTAYFNANGLSSMDYITDDPSNMGNKTIIKTDEKPHIVDEGNGLSYYTCPETLWYSSTETEMKEEDNTTVFYRAYSTTKTGSYDMAWNLLKASNYNGIMMIKTLPDSYEEEIEQEEPLDPLTCSYTKKVGNDQRTITITYHDRKTVSANYTGIVVSGMVNKADTSYILNSEYFKNWQCPPENVVYAYLDNDGVLHVAYDKESLGDNDFIFEYEGDEEIPEDDVEPGDQVYGCDVIPEEIRDWINSTLNLVKYVALALVIVLGILDFIKAAASGEADQMKKSGSKFLKRIIAVVILFLLPVIVELVLNLIEIYGADSACL